MPLTPYPAVLCILKQWNFLSFVNATILIVSVFPIQLALTFRMTLHTYYKYLTRKMEIIHTSTRILHSKRYRPILCPLLVLMFQHSSSVQSMQYLLLTSFSYVVRPFRQVTASIDALRLLLFHAYYSVRQYVKELFSIFQFHHLQ